MLGLDRRIGWVIFVLALILRLAWSLHLQNQTYWIDEDDFFDIAQHIVHGDGYVSRSFRANPTLPYYMAAVEKIAGPDHFLAPARIGQSVLGALSCVLIWRIAAGMAGEAAGGIAGILAAIYPPYIAVCGWFYVDCLLNFFLSLSIYFCMRVMGAAGRGLSKAAGLAVATGIALGLTALTRPIFLLGIPCVGLAWLYAANLEWRRRLLLLSLLLLGSAVMILPWTLRNQARYHRFILISTGLGTKLWQGNNELADGSAFDRELYWNNWDQSGYDGPESWNARLNRLDATERHAIQAKYAVVETQVKSRLAEFNRAGYEDDRELAADKVLEPIAVAWMKEHPMRVASLFLKKLVPLYSALSPTISEDSQPGLGKRIIAAVSFYPVLALALVGMVLSRPRRRKFMVIYLLIGSVSAAYCMLNTCTRFRWPLDGFLIVFAAVAIVYLRDRFWKQAT
jgi:4-amino-4-deoxy-L-arabinose transferase-like glycosyltransferase